MHFLITAGPTREYIDPVRFLSNPSTGKMGYACVKAALRRGHKVTLISGPVDLPRPAGARLIKVISSDQMYQSVRDHYERCNCVIMAAAVCDYRPARPSKQKIQKRDRDLTLKLQRTVDILAELGKLKTHQILIGFAVQDRAGQQNARKKLNAKNLDAIILNSPASFGADTADMQILTRSGPWQTYPNIRKNTLATHIIKLAEKLLIELQSVG